VNVLELKFCVLVCVKILQKFERLRPSICSCISAVDKGVPFVNSSSVLRGLCANFFGRFNVKFVHVQCSMARPGAYGREQGDIGNPLKLPYGKILKGFLVNRLLQLLLAYCVFSSRRLYPRPHRGRGTAPGPRWGLPFCFPVANSWLRPWYVVPNKILWGGTALCPYREYSSAIIVALV